MTARSFMRNFMGFGYTKSLATLCVVLSLVACGEEGGGAASGVSWTPPSQRSDGTGLAMSEIAGYRIYYGATEGNYPNQVDIANGIAQQATVVAPSGVYFVVVTSYDQQGRESGYSSPAIKIRI